MMVIDKKYRDDTVFNKINSRFLTLKEEERKINNEHLKLVVEKTLIPLMKKTDELFNLMYNRIIYGGSFYKGTKYGKPEEFDLDFIIKLPLDYTNITIEKSHDYAGFVKIKLNSRDSFNAKSEKYRKKLQKLLTNDNYLDQNVFRAWVESVFSQTFSQLSITPKGHTFEYEGKLYLLKLRKTGPAFTVIIRTPNGSVIDVDLVPCLEFENVPLNYGYKLKGNERKWMVVAKPLFNVPKGNILWRLCFYETEKNILNGEVKPVIRMMKKFRDTMKWHSIKSYFIETIFFHALEKNENNLQYFLNAPKTCLFMHGLERLKEALETKRLQYYWHENLNLFFNINYYELEGYANRLNRIIKQINKRIESDKYILAHTVLEPDEVSILLGVPDKNNIQDSPPPPDESPLKCIIL